MSHETTEVPVSPIEREFNEFMRQGDDFFRIELLRQAKKCYVKAQGLNFEHAKVNQQIAQCDSLLAHETKIVKIICAVAVVVIAACWILIR